MPSEASGVSAPSRWSWLWSQGLGLGLGQATVGLLGIGSVVISATRGGASAGVRLDELGGFFSPPGWTHAWLYLLLPVVALYALNTLLCTWQSVLARWRRGTRDLAAWAPSVIHLAFLFALLSHLVGGFHNREGESLTLTRSWTALEDGRRVRLVHLETELTSTQKVKAIHATLEVADLAGPTEQTVIGYNQPLSSGLGSDLLLVSQAGQLMAATFTYEGEQCRTEVPGECMLGGARLLAQALRESTHWGSKQVAVLRLEEPGVPAESFPLAQGAARTLASGKSLTFEGVAVEDAVEVRRRLAPGHPFAAISAVVLVVGLAMMGRRWSRQSAPEASGLEGPEEAPGSRSSIGTVAAKPDE